MRPSAPELRFPEFKSPWKPARASDAFRNSKARGEAGLPIYSVTQDRGLIRRDSLERHMGADAADETNLRAQPGDLVYNMMRMWQGAVGMASEECMVSPAYVVLSPEKGISSKFFDYWFQNRHMLHQLWAYSHGLTNDRLRLYYQDFAKIPLALPDQPEQEKIAAVLDAASRKIRLLTDKKTALEDYKRGLMQRLFSREIRFARDDGSAFPDWEERKLGDVFNWVRTNSLSREHLGDDPASGVQNIHYGDIHGKFRPLFFQSKEDAPFIATTAPFRGFKGEEFLRQGDVVIADASEDYSDIGKAIEVMEVAPDSAVAGLHTYIARPKAGSLVLGFSGYLLRSAPMRQQIMRIAQGISVLGVSKGNLEKLAFWLPHPDEQRKIAAVLSTLDIKIDTLSQNISEMEAFKKGLVQKLFV